MVFSLQKRFLFFLLLPLTLMLLIMGVGSFIYARSYLLDQWKSTTKLRLEKTAHQIQMRLDKERALIDLIVKAEIIPESAVTQAFLAQELAEMPGVRFVEIQPLAPKGPRSEHRLDGAYAAGPSAPPGIATVLARHVIAMNHMGRHGMRGGPGLHGMNMRHMMGMQRGELSFDEAQNFLSIVRTFGGTDSSPTKRIVVTIAFESFMEGLLEVGHWQYAYACLVKSDGRYLAHTNPAMSMLGRLGDSGDPLEKKVLEEMKTKDFGTVLGEGHPADRVMGFYKVPTTDWYLVLVSRGDVVLAPIVRFRSNYTLAGILSLLCVGVLIRWNTRPIAQSVTEISKASEAVASGDYSVQVPEDRSDEIGMLKRRFNEMVLGLKERDLIERTFGRYVDSKIAAELLAKPEALQMGGKHQVVTILMADLRGFTQMCEPLMPAEVIKILNRHFSKMITVIEGYRGIIVDFYGDSILVFFNGGDDNVPERALDAVACALKMQDELEAVSRQNREEGLPELKMGIGIHTGDVIVGNIGSETRAKYGIVGSAVNETDRIQSCAEAGTTVVSEQTYRDLADKLEVSPKPKAWLKGLEGPRDLYEVKAIRG